MVKTQEMWIEYVESSAELGNDPLPSRWVRIYLRTTSNLAEACRAWRVWVYDMLMNMLPRAGEMNPSEALPDPEDLASAEMLSVLRTKFSIRLDMDLVLGLSYEQLYCLMDDKFGHNDEIDDASSESESEGGAPKVPKPAGEGGGVLDPASDPGPNEKKAGDGEHP